MNQSSSRRRPLGLWVLCTAAVAISLGIVIIAFMQRVQAATSGSVAVTYSKGVVRVAIPYDARRAGAGQLTVEVLDPEDRVVARTEQNVEIAAAGKGMWRQELKLEKALSLDDLAWHRLRYRFAYADGTGDIHGTDSMSEILRMPVVHIMADQSYLSGGPAAVRVIVTDSNNEPIPGPGSLRIDLVVPDQKQRTLFAGRLDGRGTAQAQFQFPAGLVGTYSLRYAVDTTIGSTEYTQSVRLEDKAAVLLTTEKPIYQPGQTIHVRALALDRARHQATGGRNLTFEMEDSRGNKVFKRATQTDKFGIASAEFALADEVNLGTYHLRAIMDSAAAGNAPTTAEIALNVERYVLPKFKVAVEFGSKDKAAKRGYRPGDHVTGTVRANYFFGKPVDNAEITVKASGMDVAVFDAGSAHGKTNADGAYRFDIPLPAYFAGKPLSGGAARVLVEATVKDAAGHSETRGEPITVSQSPLLVTAIPEGGKLIPDLDNQVFIVTSYPDGSPARADITVHAAGSADQKATTDDGGVAVVRVKAAGSSMTLGLDAADKDGNRASTSLNLDVRQAGDQILLRTEHAVYRAGDRIELRVLSTKSRGAAYVDVIKDGQTVLTRDLDIVNGQAELALTATPEMAGTLDINAYLFGRDARPVGDHRLVFVQPADELKIEASTDAPSYKPGDDARIRFHVTNQRGEGVQAALGVQVVDEAVFALAEKQPGFAKVFFYLEQEAMKPRYEIHSIGMPDVVEPVPLAQADRRDRAARALFSATETVTRNRFETEFGNEAPQAKYAVYAERYRTHFLAQLRKSRADALLKGQVPDAWGTDLRMQRVNWAPRELYYMAHSAGPDKRFNTPDDMWTYVRLKPRKVDADPNAGTLDVNIEHDRGPVSAFAQITGSVIDMAGAAVANAEVTVRDASTQKTRKAATNAGGQFVLSGVPAGRYKIEVACPGFRVAKDEFALAARDRAVVSATLSVGAVNDVVEVEAAGPRIRFGGNLEARGGVIGGFGGGAPRGVKMMRAEGRQFDAAALMAPAPMVTVATLSITKEPISPAPRERSYFPEALYINPEIITDKNGSATISIPLADSITTWRMAMMASTVGGALGSGASSIKVFQDFFTDLDLPVTLTQGDRVSIPVAVYNYSGSRGDVRLELKPSDWFSLIEDVPTKNVAVESDRVGGSQFIIQANRIGKFKLTLAARMTGESDRADIVVREIEVVPNGREQNMVFNGHLDSSVQEALNFPPESIPDASKVYVRLYPGPLSQVIEGMDAILRMPSGCFEQTSSSTYPNVLALDYMKRTGKLTPEVHAKAEGFIASGYQRLLTFEVPSGGFSWFGNAPANKILTAYGLMEFSDMSKVHDVDPKLIQRTQQWLAGQQQPVGDWKPDTQFINEGATNRFNSDVLRITAYLAWSLENTGYRGAAVEKAKQYIDNHVDAKADAYTLAVVANFAADYGKDRDFTNRAMQMLLDARKEKGEQTWWTSEQTGMYGMGESASVETTGLAVQALLKWGQASAVARKALAYIASKKDATGAWGTTQATIMALRSLLLASEKSASDVRGTVEIVLNGQTAEKLTLTPDNNDLLHQFVFKNVDAKGSNTVEVRFQGKGGLAYQIAGQYFVPWAAKPDKEPLSITVDYDRTHLAQNDIATATATIRNNLPKSANMVMVDLGIPPGFDPLTEDLQAYQEKSVGLASGRLEKFNLTATQAILYFDAIGAGDTVKVSLRFRAKYPIRAKTFQSRVYEYYDPAVSATARPVQLEITKR